MLGVLREAARHPRGGRRDRRCIRRCVVIGRGHPDNWSPEEHDADDCDECADLGDDGPCSTHGGDGEDEWKVDEYLARLEDG